MDRTKPPDLTSVRTRADLEAAVAWVLTFTPGDGAEVSDADLRSVMTAAESYRQAGIREALLSLADELDRMSAEWGEAGLGAASCGLSDAANRARERAAGHHGGTP